MIIKADAVLTVTDGSARKLPKDLDQAAKMLNMRIKVDVWSQRLDEHIRIEIREHLRDLFCQLPARRVWLYLKDVRRMHLQESGKGGTFESLDPDRIMEGPEDVIANGKCLPNDELTLLYP